LEEKSLEKQIEDDEEFEPLASNSPERKSSVTNLGASAMENELLSPMAAVVVVALSGMEHLPVKLRRREVGCFSLVIVELKLQISALIAK